MCSWYDLVPRQRQIMLELARGHSNQEIADLLGVRLTTVRNNVADAYKRIGVNNRVLALRWVIEQVGAEAVLDAA